MARIFGVAMFPSSGAGIICTNFNEDENAEKVQARDETGQVIDEWAYSVGRNFSSTGLLDDAAKLPKVGEIFTLFGKEYLLDSISKPKTNTGAAEVTFSGSAADDAILHPYSEVKTYKTPADGTSSSESSTEQ